MNGTCHVDCPTLYVKTFNTSNNLWTCLLDITKQVDNTTGEVIQIEIPVKGIMVPVFYPFIASYVTAGMFTIVGMMFMFKKVCSAKRGLFFPFVTGLLALPETFAIGGCLFYHFMYNYYDYLDMTKFML